MAEDTAVELPAVRGALAGRTSSSEDAGDLCEHVCEGRRDVALPMSELAHPSDEGEVLGVAAAYREIVFRAVRGGARRRRILRAGGV